MHANILEERVKRMRPVFNDAQQQDKSYRAQTEHRKFCLNEMENLFVLRVTEHQNRLSREMTMSPSLQIPKPGHNPVQPALVDPALTAGLD